MKRIKIQPRENWQAKVETLGFSFHTLNNEKYWDESVYYQFSYQQIDAIENSTREIHRLCLAAVDYILKYDLMDLFSIPKEFKPMLQDSWKKNQPSVYGRFDISWDGDLSQPPKMLEYNADTPTSLFEAGVVQWFWLKEFNDKMDQFNSIHEKLIAGWKRVEKEIRGNTFYFSCLDEFPEDMVTLHYLRDCAVQAGLSTQFISIHDIGRNSSSFTDLNEKPIEYIFKLYPWEWMISEEFGALLPVMKTQWIEPSWKMLLSNKAILAVLWELFPGHPNLLECYFDDQGPMKSYAMKPLLSREGANVTLVENGDTIGSTEGEYGEEGYIFQQLHKLPCIDGYYPVIGSWVIDGQPAGIGIRENGSLVTDNFSRFVPHAIENL